MKNKIEKFVLKYAQQKEKENKQRLEQESIVRSMSKTTGLSEYEINKQIEHNKKTNQFRIKLLKYSILSLLSITLSIVCIYIAMEMTEFCGLCVIFITGSMFVGLFSVGNVYSEYSEYMKKWNHFN